jgi:hypothetical protein
VLCGAVSVHHAAFGVQCFVQKEKGYIKRREMCIINWFAQKERYIYIERDALKKDMLREEKNIY